MSRREINIENGEFVIGVQEDESVSLEKKFIYNIETNKEEDKKENEIDFTELEKQYELREQEIKKALEEPKDLIKESKKGALDVFKKAVGMAKASFSERNKISEAQIKAEKEITKIEDAALEVPENAKIKVLSDNELEIDIANTIKNLQKDTKDLLRDFEEKREKFVEKQIEETIKAIKSRYEDVFGETINARNAENIIIYKTKKEIQEAAREFIQSGNEGKFGVVKMSLRVSSLKTGEEENETEKKYITGFVINIGGYEKKIGEKYSPEGYPLVLNSVLRKMVDEKRYNRKAVETKIVS